MPQLREINQHIVDINQWRKVTEHRVDSIERQRSVDAEKVGKVRAEVSEMGARMSRMEGGIEFIKWAVPISITLSTVIGTCIVWVVMRTVG